MIDRVARNLQCAAERREKDAECEYTGEQPLLIDAERGHHVAVLRRGTHQHAPSRAMKQQPQRAEHHRPQHHQQHIVSRDRLAEEVERAAQTRRAGAEQIVRPPDQHREILDHQRQTEGREKLE